MEFQMRQSVLAVAFLAATAALTACGGGGGGGSTLPPAIGAPGGGTGASPTPTPTAAPTATPRPVTQSVMRGQVVDSSGAPVSGATVLVVPLENLGVNTTPQAIASTTTASDGSFTTPTFSTAGHTTVGQSGVLETMGLVVVTQGYASLHAYFPVGAGTYTITQPLPITQPTSTEQQWLTQVNADRATVGAQPLIFDDYALLAARWKAQDMATHAYCSHTTDPTGAYYITFPGAIAGTNENLGCLSTWQLAEQAFMAEAPSGGHYLNLTNTANIWVGLGVVINPDYVTQEFMTSANVI
ncbi:hypothetical protein EPN44_14245 [bacterium]|nr:MAG: hypothetical protein EPN44_14245 [bacterium]